MRLDYQSETDSLRIDLAEKPSVEEVLVAPGVFVAFDDAGIVVAVRVTPASKAVDWSRLELVDLPLQEAPVMSATCGPDVADADSAPGSGSGEYPSSEVDDYSGAGQQEGAE